MERKGRGLPEAGPNWFGVSTLLAVMQLALEPAYHTIEIKYANDNIIMNCFTYIFWQCCSFMVILPGSTARPGEQEIVPLLFFSKSKGR